MTINAATATDTKLVALGARLESIREQLTPLRAEHRRLGNEAREYAYGLTGCKPDPENPPGLTEQYLAAYGEMGDRNGFHACDKRLEALHRELDLVMREIMRATATSIVGLRIKTLAAIEANGHLWDKTFYDLDRGARAIRSMIEAACAVTQIPVSHEESEAAERDHDVPVLHHGSAALN